MADDVTKKLDELRRRASEHYHEARATIAMMNTLETVWELPLTVLEDLETSVLGEPSQSVSVAPGRQPEARFTSQSPRRASLSIRPDEYFGVEPMEAAKMFMRSVGHAVMFDEITDAVQKGGAATKGADWRDNLEISLKRSPYQVITVADKTYGLAEFYTEDQLKRFRTNRKGDTNAPPKKKTRGKQKPKAKTVVARVAKTKKAQPANNAADSGVAHADEHEKQ